MKSTKPTILPILPNVSCPKCLCKLIPEKMSGGSAETGVIYLHWASDCSRSGDRFEVLAPYSLGFPCGTNKSHKAKR
jgi:hypothetical protein